VRTALIVTAIVALVVSLGVEYTRVHNRLLTQREAILTQWAEVDGAMQRRADLILNLVTTAGGLPGKGSEVIEKISDARGALADGRTPQEKIAAYDRLNFAILRLLAVVHSDRRLKPREKLWHFEDEVSNTDNDVNIERRKYNEALQTYNTTLQLFPNNIVAAISGFERDDAYFQTGVGAEEAPKAQF
jgi:LemA protein